MRRLTIAGNPVPLMPDASITFDLSSNLLDLLAESNSSGSHSMPFTVPDTAEARLAFGDLQRLDNRLAQPVSYPATFEENGFYLKGNFELRSYIPNSGFRGNLITSEKAIIKKLKEQKIRNLNLGGTISLGANTTELLDNMAMTIYQDKVDKFTFGPVHNPGYYKENEDYLIHKGQYLNRFMPGMNTYPENTDTHEYGPKVGTFYAICPFPSLYYVITEGFKELGLNVEDQFFDDELKKLVVLCNSSLDEVELVTWKEGEVNYDFMGGKPTTYEPGAYRFKNRFKRTFKIGDLLPDLTFHELLRKLQNTFGMLLTVKLDGTVKLTKVEPILSNPTRINLTNSFLKGHEQEYPSKKGVILKYRKEGSDGFADEDIKDISELNYLGEVESLDQISYTNRKPKDCYYVIPEKAYYVYGSDKTIGGWWVWEEFTRYAGDYSELKIADGATPYTMGIATTVDQERHWLTIQLKPDVQGWPEMEALTDSEMGDVRLNLAVNQYFVYTQSWEITSEGESIMDWLFFCENTEEAKSGMFAKWKVPALNLEGFTPIGGQMNASKELRLAFWRGLQHLKGIGYSYPMLSGDNYTINGERIGEYTLKWHGADGIAAKFLSSWLKMKQGKGVRGNIDWRAEQLENVNLEELYSLEGQRAIIKNIKFTLPLKKAAQVELILF